MQSGISHLAWKTIGHRLVETVIDTAADVRNKTIYLQSITIKSYLIVLYNVIYQQGHMIQVDYCRRQLQDSLLNLYSLIYRLLMIMSHTAFLYLFNIQLQQMEYFNSKTNTLNIYYSSQSVFLCEWVHYETAQIWELYCTHRSHERNSIIYI